MLARQERMAELGRQAQASNLCQCDSPIIRCDDHGCNCTRCRRPKNMYRELLSAELSRLRNEDGLDHPDSIRHELGGLPASPSHLAREAIERAIDFIAREYRDPSYEPDGEWLPPEARKIHSDLCAALQPLSQGNGEAVKYEYRRHRGMGDWIECGKANYDTNPQYEYRALYAAPPSQPEGVREALEAIERGITAVRLDAALNEQPISPDVFEQFHKDILAAIKLTTTPSPGLVEAAEWQPIETAPKDGQHFLVSLVDSNHTQHVREAWCEIDDHTDKPALIWVGQSFDEGAVILIPKYWTPLPAPPGTGAAKGGIR